MRRSQLLHVINLAVRRSAPVVRMAIPACNAFFNIARYSNGRWNTGLRRPLAAAPPGDDQRRNNDTNGGEPHLLVMLACLCLRRQASHAWRGKIEEAFLTKWRFGELATPFAQGLRRVFTAKQKVS